MQKIVAWAGNPYFVSHMRNAGCHVAVLPRSLHTLTWADITRHCGAVPDIFIYGDCSVPPFVRDIESFPCATVFYAIDTHIHSWYPRYAQAFDLCCVAMRDHLSTFAGHRLDAEQILWLPLFAKDHDRRIETHDDSRYEVVFVGKNDPLLTPGRHKLLHQLDGKVPLTVLQGRYDELYARAKLVLNVSEHGDLNFRVFETLGCGACLVTPRVGHGLLDLFSDGKELFTYDADDLTHLVALIRELLANEARRREVADAGLAAVTGKHRAADRAREFMAWISAHDLALLVRNRLAAKEWIRQNCLRLLYLHLAHAEADAERARMYVEFAGPGPAL